MVPRHVPRMYLSPEELRKLHFKPTIGPLQLSEGHEAKVNCSIDIPDIRLDPVIFWVKDGKDLSSNIHELKSIADGVLTLVSTVMYVSNKGKMWGGGEIGYDRLKTQNDVPLCIICYSIKYVQRVDAGEYRCRLSISNMLVESDPISIRVEGEFYSNMIPGFFLCPHVLQFFHTSLNATQVYQRLSSSQRTRM